MASEEKIPPAGESVTEVTLIKFTVADGAAVKEGDPIAEVETDKANADLFASGSGVITFTGGISPGSVLKIGTTYATIDANAKPAANAPAATASATPVAGHAGPAGTNGPAAPLTPAQSKPAAASSSSAASSSAASSSVAVSPPPTRAPTKAGNIEDLSPGARRVATERDVDVASVTGTGPGGRITQEDVTAASQQSSTATPPTATPPAASPQTSPPISPATQSTASVGGMRRVPMSKIRKRIAENLVRAKNTTAMLTTFNEVDMSAIMKLRAAYKEPFEKKHGIGLGFMSFFVKACTIALKQYERVNGQLDGDDVLLFDHVHMGVAVSTERGLTVPIVKHADAMSFARIETEIKRVATAARDGKLGIDEMSGGTFTITNGGIFGSLNSTPIVNPPQSAILGMHAIVERAVVIAGKVEVRPIMNLALSYDHRIIDGKESVTFLVRVKQLLEDPTRLMLDV